MSELGEIKIPEEVIEAIQATLPDGQVIRHVGIMFVATNLIFIIYKVPFGDLGASLSLL